MKLLVTGASGYISDKFLHTINYETELFLVSRNTSRSVLMPNKNCHEVIWDMTESIPLEKFPSQIDVIVHFAQSRNYRDLDLHTEEMFLVNTASTAALLRYAKLANAKYFCFISTGSVYPSSPLPIQESSAFQATTFLGASKLAAENLLAPYSNCFKSSILRLFMPYGPHQVGRLLQQLITRISSGQAIDIAGAKKQGSIFSNIYISDVIRIINYFIENQISGTYNIASSEGPLSIVNMCELLAHKLQTEAHYNYNPLATAVSYIADTKKLAEIYPDFYSMVKFEHGIEQIITMEKLSSVDHLLARS